MWFVLASVSGCGHSHRWQWRHIGCASPHGREPEPCQQAEEIPQKAAGSISVHRTTLTLTALEYAGRDRVGRQAFPGRSAKRSNTCGQCFESDITRMCYFCRCSAGSQPRFRFCSIFDTHAGRYLPFQSNVPRVASRTAAPGQIGHHAPPRGGCCGNRARLVRQQCCAHVSRCLRPFVRNSYFHISLHGASASYGAAPSTCPASPFPRACRFPRSNQR